MRKRKGTKLSKIKAQYKYENKKEENHFGEIFGVFAHFPAEHFTLVTRTKNFSVGMVRLIFI